MRRLAVGAVVALALVLVSPGISQRSDQPNRLWSEYPLVPEAEPTGTRTIGPLLPPSDSESAPVSGDSTRLGVWLAVATLGLIAVLLAARTVRAPAISRPTAREPRPIQLRPSPPPVPRVPAGKPLSQYAPHSDKTPDVEDEPRRFVIRRTGLVRSRFVVFADELSGMPSVVVSSRSFWRVGGGARNERSAENAWDDLMNELRLSGWEQESARRSDYYISLRRVDPVSSSVLPTIEAYTHAEDPGRG